MQRASVALLLLLALSIRTAGVASARVLNLHPIIGTAAAALDASGNPVAAFCRAPRGGLTVVELGGGLEAERWHRRVGSRDTIVAAAPVVSLSGSSTSAIFLP